MDDANQEIARREEARRLLAQLDAQIAMNRARRESSTGRRSASRLFSVLILFALIAVMVWMLFWVSSRLPVANETGTQPPKGTAP